MGYSLSVWQWEWTTALVTTNFWIGREIYLVVHFRHIWVDMMWTAKSAHEAPKISAMIFYYDHWRPNEALIGYCLIQTYSDWERECVCPSSRYDRTALIEGRVEIMKRGLFFVVISWHSLLRQCLTSKHLFWYPYQLCHILLDETRAQYVSGPRKAPIEHSNQNVWIFGQKPTWLGLNLN
jgi:hypothetical protein